jgi:hypothetical protein
MVMSMKVCTVTDSAEEAYATVMRLRREGRDADMRDVRWMPASERPRTTCRYAVVVFDRTKGRL